MEMSDTHLRAWSTFLAAHSAAIADVEDALHRAGLPPLGWYDVLLPLRRAERPLRMGELAGEVVTIGRTGLTRLVDRLDAAGLVTRMQCPEDRRGVQVAITAAGEDLLARMRPVYLGAVAERFAGAMTEAQARTLTRMLSPVATGARGERAAATSGDGVVSGQ
jgi:DNA-binding MarR family transcriptional regulator